MANLTILEALTRSLTGTKSYIDKIAATKVDKVDGKGLSTNDLTDILKANYETAYAHSQAAHAPSNAQANADITKAEIEAKLTGDITSHTHNQYLTEHQDLSSYARTSDIPTSLPANGGNADTVGGYTIWVGTQAQYNAISSKSSTTIYLIKEG